MKTLRMQSIVLSALLVCFLVYLVYSATLLPERVATHFGSGGRPNGWMGRSGYLIFMGVLGVGLPLILVVVILFIRHIPDQLINLPNKEYWLSPEHNDEYCSYMSGHLLWLACLEVVFFAGIHFFTVEANHAEPVQLNMEIFWPLLIGFVAAVLLWSLVLIFHFAKTK